jgi:6-phosphogluconolactonase
MPPVIKVFLIPLLLLILPLMVQAGQERFYVGVYTGPGKGEGIYMCPIDADSGELGPVTLAGKANGPGYLAFSPDGSHLYSVVSDGGGSVSAYAIGKDGALTFLNQVSSGGSGPTHLSVDPSGKNLLVANYGGGSIACIKINPDGSLGARTDTFTFQGSGPDPVRQKKPFPHCIFADRSDRFVYACDLGTDHVWSFHFDAAAGQFRDLAPGLAKVPSGGGARHLAFGRGEDFAYVNSEMGRAVTVFRRDGTSGSLTAIQTLPLMPGAGPAAGVTTAETVCHPSGKWLYVSSRGDDIIAVFAIGADGRLTFVEDVPSEVKFPRGFGIDPSGRWLIAAGQNDDRVVVFAIAQDSGKLTATGQMAKVPSPVCVMFPPGR